MRRRLLFTIALSMSACATDGSDVDATHVSDGGRAGNDAAPDEAGAPGGSAGTTHGGAGGTSGSGGGAGLDTGGASPGGQGGSAGAAGAGGYGGGAAGSGGTAGFGGTGGAGGCNTDSNLSGIWVEEAELTCDGGERVPEQTLWELSFAGNTLNVTWTPFETYVDYWGSYQDMPDGPGTGTLHLQVDGGNFVPTDIDADGRYTLCGDTLILEDMWLGTYQGVTAPPGCGHRFRR